MTKFFSVLLAVAAVVMTGSAAEAQSYSNGYQFGAGIQSAGFGHCGGNGNFFRSFTREQPPYFAQFPPVYYSHIVPRPYGISPYAAPAGIVPVEMTVPQSFPNPAVIKNPYFDRSVKTEVPQKSVSPVEGKTTSKIPVWTTNPHSQNLTQELSLIE